MDNHRFVMIFLLIFSIALMVDGILFMAHNMMILGVFVLLIGVCIAIFSRFVIMVAKTSTAGKIETALFEEDSFINTSTVEEEDFVEETVIEPLIEDESEQERLQKLIELKNNKLISKKEYNQKRKEILSRL